MYNILFKMASNPTINYSNKSFIKSRQALISYIEEYYPSDLQDFNDSSIGIAFIELISVASDILNHSINVNFSETQLSNAQQRKNILEIGKNMGVKIPNTRSSVTLIDISVNLPAKGSTPDWDYAPVLQTDTSFTGAGRVFTLSQPLDFASGYSSFGLPNRKIIPNLIDSNGVIQNYTITKKEVVYNGLIKIFPVQITSSNSIPFLEVILPDVNVVDIEQIILMPGFNNSPTINDFYKEDITYYEVDWLLQNRIFVPDTARPDENGMKAGKWLKVDKKFIKEFTANGYCKLTFGGGNPDVNVFQQAINSNNFTGLDNYLQNTSLGVIPPVNSTLFIRYRIGGGANSNVGSNTINQIGNLNMTITGPDPKVVAQVKRSIVANNLIPALGGADSPSTEMIRNMISYNFAAQDRCITLGDYLGRISLMNGQFGAPFRYRSHLENNKVVIPILGIDENGKLNNSSNNLLKTNISDYLSQYRSLNDYVEVRDGKIYNLSILVKLYIDDFVPSQQIVLQVISVISDFFDIKNSDMGQDILLAQLVESINNVPGVLNILSYQIFNKVGGYYSLNEIEMAYKDEKTREIQLVNNSLYSNPDSMFEIKSPNSDIGIVCVKKNQLPY